MEADSAGVMQQDYIGNRFQGLGSKGLEMAQLKLRPFKTAQNRVFRNL